VFISTALIVEHTRLVWQQMYHAGVSGFFGHPMLPLEWLVWFVLNFSTPMFGLFLVLKSEFVRRLIFGHSPNLCRECGYVLDGLRDAICPECGKQSQITQGPS
jgi:hypothetical protein